jgi:hypothetical protein
MVAGSAIHDEVEDQKKSALEADFFLI